MRRPRNFIGPMAMAGTVSLWGTSSLIKSIQSGTLGNSGGVTNTATISAVVPENCLLQVSFTSQAAASSDARNSWCRIDLTNSTTLTITINFNAGFVTTIAYQVIEFMPGVLKSVQRGTISVATGTTTNTAALATVNLAKAFVTYLGMTEDSNSSPPMWDAQGQSFKLEITNSTTVTATRNTAVASNNVIAYQIGELF